MLILVGLVVLMKVLSKLTQILYFERPISALHNTGYNNYIGPLKYSMILVLFRILCDAVLTL
jgi:hypothetical protein